MGKRETLSPTLMRKLEDKSETNKNTTKMRKRTKIEISVDISTISSTTDPAGSATKLRTVTKDTIENSWKNELASKDVDILLSYTKKVRMQLISSAQGAHNLNLS